jgi:hypothetical protein
MAFGVHALDVGVIVAPLQAIRRALCGARSCQGAHCQSGTGSHGSAAATIDGSAGYGADHRTDRGALEPAVRGGLIGRGPAYLHTAKLSAVEIVGPKLVEALAGARQHHHPGTGRHRGACANQKQSQQGCESKCAGHGLQTRARTAAAGLPAASLPDIP